MRALKKWEKYFVIGWILLLASAIIPIWVIELMMKDVFWELPLLLRLIYGYTFLCAGFAGFFYFAVIKSIGEL